MGEPRSSYRFIAEAGQSLERLDKFVVERLAEEGAAASRSAVQRWIRAERVKVGGAPAQASDSVAVGSAVDVAPMPPETTSLLPDPDVAFDVVFEDDHLIVVDKPAGLVVHPGRGHADKTLMHGLLARGTFPKSVDLLVDRTAGNDAADDAATARPGVVHRLDKGTSGILVVAKDERTREGLKALFAAHDIERAYVAIVVGSATDAVIETLHGRHPSDRLRFTTRVSRGKRAVTRVRVVERFGAAPEASDRVSRAGKRLTTNGRAPSGVATLVECRLETGRTHQIRVHLCEIGQTPILGDPVYGRAPSDPRLEEIGERLGRQALHAFLLGFVHPVTGEKMRFEREPPADFQAAAAALRSLGR